VESDSCVWSDDDSICSFDLGFIDDEDAGSIGRSDDGYVFVEDDASESTDEDSSSGADEDGLDSADSLLKCQPTWPNGGSRCRAVTKEIHDHDNQ
jgi:hypothetical protein